VPQFSSFKLSSTPRYLEPTDVDRVLDACTGDDALGLRDRAVMLLLARLAFRASDVALLTLRDIDWQGGRIGVQGKGRRREWLPLPQEVGDAILRYIREARPRIISDRVFTKVWAPVAPLTRAGVGHIARSALRRAGVSAPSNGAHLFRHSAATAMLRHGASLAGVGAVLRHRRPSTTAIYAKVDFDLLREIAQPWPEETSC
jgi:site-specific recombinase XerD